MEIINNAYKVGFPGILFAGAGSLYRIEEVLKDIRPDSIVVLIDKAVLPLPAVTALFSLLGERLKGVIDTVPPEPKRDDIREIYETARKLAPQLMIAVGGGSVMDMTKVVAAAVRNEAFAEDGFGNTELIKHKGIPTVMIPTTAGTGAEATPNAIFLVPEQELKVGVVSNTFVATYVILEPGLTVGLPGALTAATGIDALCHAVESYLSKLANPVSREFSLKAAGLIGRNIERAYTDGTDIIARENMLLGSFFAGMCLFSSTTVAVHALSYPLGGKYHIPHGMANAILLPGVLKANLSVCGKEYKELAKVIMPKEELKGMENVAEGFTEYIAGLCERLGIPKKLTGFGVRQEDIEYLAGNAMDVKRLLSQNPKELTKEEICGIYRELL